MAQRGRIRITWTQTIIGGIFMLVGLYLALPTMLVTWRYDLTDAEVIGYYPQPIAGSDEVRLVMTFEYQIHDPADRLETLVIGTGSWDRHGDEVPDRVVRAADVRTEINNLRSRRQFGRAFYDPDRPFVSGRYFVEGGLWSFQFGLVLLAAPPLSWLLTLLAQLLVRERRR